MPDPILTQLPSTRTAFTRKYGDPSLQSLLSQLPSPTRNALIQFDLQRVNRGQQPLSAAQTLKGLQSALSNQAATKTPKPSLLGSIASDVRSLVATVPRLPGAIVKEVQQLPTAPTALADVLGRGGVREVVGGLDEVPGLRLLPGVYTAAEVAEKGPGALLDHPVYTALDVLPIAKTPIARATESTLSKLPRVKAARELLPDIDQLNADRTAIGLQPVKEPSALRLAARTSPIGKAIATSRPGQIVAETFGQRARDLSQMYQGTVARIQQAANPDAPAHILTPETETLRQAVTSAREWSSAIPEPRMRQLTELMEQDRNAALSLPDLTDIERGFIEDQSRITDALADTAIRREWLPSRVDGEIFTPDQAKRIQRSRASVARYESLAAVRQRLVDQVPGVLPEGIDTRLVVSERISRADQLQLANLYTHTLDAAGFDVSTLKDTVRLAKSNSSVPIAAVRDALDYAIANPTSLPIRAVDDIIDTLAPFARTRNRLGDTSVARVLDHLRRGDIASATTVFRKTLSQRTRFVVPDADDIYQSLIRHRDIQRVLDQTKKFDARRLEIVRKSNKALEDRIAPARFQPQIERRVGERLREMYANDPSSLKAIEQGFYHLATDLGPREWSKLLGEVTRTWKQMRDEGLDPAFIHRVSPGELQTLTRPSVSDVPRTPSQIKQRMGDATPYVPDAAVAVTHQAMEFLNRIGSEEFVGQVLTTYGRTLDDLLDEYRPAAERLAGDDVASTRARAEELLRREWTEYDPKNIFAHSNVKLRKYSDSTGTLLPKVVSDNLRRLFHDGNYKLSGVFDPVMKVFRTSLLPLAPRWHFNNIFGGATMLAAETGPGAFRFMQQARELVRSGEFHTIPGMPPGGFGSVGPEIIEWNKRASFADRITATHAYKSGQFLKRMWDESEPVRTGFNKLTEKSYALNAWFDDMYRAMAYLYGNDKAIRKGLTTKQAESAGVGLVRKVMQQWDRMTPIERNIMRFVFPFYGWMNHILRYSYRYPLDHPIRTAVLGSFARNEVDDFGTALPSRFMDALFLGTPDANGNLTALNLGGINPFRDVANYFTLAGFVGNTNPIISTTLEALGVDPGKGAQDLYPELKYDSVTGRLAPRNPGLLSTFLGNTIPQTQLITAMIGTNKEFKEILRTNPEAAAAMLRSQLGLPVLFRTVNPTQEAIKAELQRQQLETEEKNKALRSGDWSRAQTFPGLQALFRQLAVLSRTNPEALAQFATEPPTTTREALGEAVVGLSTP